MAYFGKKRALISVKVLSVTLSFLRELISVLVHYNKRFTDDSLKYARIEKISSAFIEGINYNIREILAMFYYIGKNIMNICNARNFKKRI